MNLEEISDMQERNQYLASAQKELTPAQQATMVGYLKGQSESKATIDALRAEVERLAKELDEAREWPCDHITKTINGAWMLHLPACDIYCDRMTFCPICGAVRPQPPSDGEKEKK